MARVSAILCYTVLIPTTADVKATHVGSVRSAKLANASVPLDLRGVRLPFKQVAFHSASPSHFPTVMTVSIFVTAVYTARHLIYQIPTTGPVVSQAIRAPSLTS